MAGDCGAGMHPCLSLKMPSDEMPSELCSLPALQASSRRLPFTSNTIEAFAEALAAVIYHGNNGNNGNNGNHRSSALHLLTMAPATMDAMPTSSAMDSRFRGFVA
jgi:hypothetical protein